MRIIFIIRKPNPDWDRHLRRAPRKVEKPAAKFAEASPLFSAIKMCLLFINRLSNHLPTRSTQRPHPLRSLTTPFNRYAE